MNYDLPQITSKFQLSMQVQNSARLSNHLINHLGMKNFCVKCARHKHSSCNGFRGLIYHI